MVDDPDNSESILPVPEAALADHLWISGGGVTLYRNDLVDLDERFRPYFTSTTVTTNKFRYSSIRVLIESKKERFLGKISMRFSNESASSDLERFDVVLEINPSRVFARTYSTSPAAHELTRRIFNYIYSRPRRHVIFNSRGKVAFSVIPLGLQVLTLLFAFLIPFRGVVLAEVMLLVSVPVWLTWADRLWKNSVTLVEDRPTTSQFAVSGGDVVKVIIGALVGSLVTWTLSTVRDALK